MDIRVIRLELERLVARPDEWAAIVLAERRIETHAPCLLLAECLTENLNEKKFVAERNPHMYDVLVGFDSP